MSAERVNQLVEALRSGDSLPGGLRRWLVRAFEQWQQGHDIETALGLLDDGSEYSRMSHDERDDLIRVAIRLCPGESESAQASFFIEVVDGHLPHPDETGARFVGVLRGARAYIPKSLKQLRRILAGRRCDGWRYQTDGDTDRLCPTPVQRFNQGVFNKRTGT